MQQSSGNLLFILELVAWTDFVDPQLVKPLFSMDTNFPAYQSITTYHKITINYTGICHPPTSGLREHPKLMCHYIMLTLPLEFSLA
jgi:hypothetical protein